MAFNLMDPTIQVALIGAFGSLVSATIAALCAAIIGKQIAGRRRLKAKLALAQTDIAFLLEVERQHCSIHEETGGESNKNRIRKLAYERGLTWSGRFTPGRVKAELS